MRAGLCWGYWIVALCLALCGAARAQQDVHFFFAQITDTHFGNPGSVERTKRVVDRINSLPMKVVCVVHTGDITSDGVDNDAALQPGMDVLKKLRPPIHFVPGNHDIGGGRVAAAQEAYRKRFGELNGAAEYHGVRFVFLYDEPLKFPNAGLGPDPLAWLEATLKKSPNQPTLLFQHTPPTESFYDFRLPQPPPEPYRRLLRLLNAYPVKGVIGGHFHRDELRWAGDVPLFCAEPVWDVRAPQAAFRVYEYHNGKVGYQTYYAD